MALQQYARASIEVGGNEVAQASSITVNRSTNSSQVLTFGGYQGETPGACMTELTVEQMVPSNFVGVEGQGGFIDAGEFMLVLNKNSNSGKGDKGVAFTVKIENKAFLFDGFIISDVTSYQVGNNLAVSFTARGTFTTTWQ